MFIGCVIKRLRRLGPSGIISERKTVTLPVHALARSRFLPTDRADWYDENDPIISMEVKESSRPSFL